MEEFTLGEAQPIVRDIRVHAGSGAGGASNAEALAGASPSQANPVEGSELFLEFELEWRSQQVSVAAALSRCKFVAVGTMVQGACAHNQEG